MNGDEVRACRYLELQAGRGSEGCAQNMSSALFRQTKLCDSLLDALDGLIQENKIPPELGLKVLEKVPQCCKL